MRENMPMDYMKFARAKGLKTMVGAWISQDRERNEREIEALIQLAKDGQVNIAVVGNEVLRITAELLRSMASTAPVSVLASACAPPRNSRPCARTSTASTAPTPRAGT